MYASLRRLKNRLNRRGLKKCKKLSIEEVRDILRQEMGLFEGQAVLVHCGFGFLNADFSPQELIGALKEIVGKSGVIMMPFYPPALSADWLQSGRVFNSETIKCSTGVLAQCFARDPDVRISCHPIKAVAVWGDRSEELIKNHHLSKYPYDEESPYFHLAAIKGSASIGLGVRNCSMVHCAEDAFELNKSYLYSDKQAIAGVIHNGSTVDVSTYFHHGREGLMSSAAYFEKYCSDVVSIFETNGVVFYSADNGKMMFRMKKLLTEKVNRLDC